MLKAHVWPTLAICLAGCAAFGGTKEIDPLAGWGGLWVGEYQSENGDVGALELEFSVDTAGAPLGVARFDSGGGMQQVRLLDPVLSSDSIKTAMEFDDLYAEFRGARASGLAEGVYVVRPSGQEDVVDSGTWRVTAQAAR